MKIIDIPNPKRVQRGPDQSVTLVSSGSFSEDGFLIKRVELRLYTQNIDEKLGPLSLITSLVETDKGSVEMIFDEGYRGENSLEKTKEFLISSLGISGLILRSLITLREEIKKHNT